VFDALKYVLVQASLLYPPEYQCDYFLYLAAAISTIEMVLAQEYDLGNENPICYLSQNPTDTEIQYSHVEKLDLAAIQAIQIFRHYILLRKTMVILDCSPMTYISSHQSLGVK